MTDPDWLRAQLFERRTVFVSGVLDDLAAGRVAAELMTLDANGDDPVRLHLDATCTSMDAAFTIMDVIDLMGIPVHATCAGRAEGPAVGVLAVAHRRAIAPHARLRLTEPRSSFSGHASEVTGWATEHRRQLDQFCGRLASASRLSADEVAEELRVGRWLDADEAVRLRLVDEIARPGAEVTELHGRRIGFRGQP